jgi:uroporphyrinogen-III synthase
MLSGYCVAITRPADQAGEMVHAVEEFGGVPLLYPLICTRPLGTEGIRRANQARWDALVFTSKAGVDAYARACLTPGEKLDAPAPPAYCVGGQTAKAARSYGLTVAVEPSEANAGALVQAMLNSGVSSGRALLVQGQLADDTVRTALESAGWVVQKVVGYETIGTGQAARLLDAVACRSVDVLTFASGSAVREFASCLAGRSQAVDVLGARLLIAAIGPSTCRVLHEVGLAPQITASKASGRDLIHALSDYIERSVDLP